MPRPVGRCARDVFAALGLAALAGCVTPPPAATPGALSGRLSLQVDATLERAAQAFSADFDLRGSADQGAMRLSTPLGTTLAEARWTADGALLVTPQGQRRFEDLDALSRETFGQALPLRALPDWLRGRPWPGAASRPTATPPENGFEQLGWTVDTARADQGRLSAHWPGPPAVRLQARLDAAP